jgi:hypothetical protein
MSCTPATSTVEPRWGTVAPDLNTQGALRDAGLCRETSFEIRGARPLHRRRCTSKPKVGQRTLGWFGSRPA